MPKYETITPAVLLDEPIKNDEKIDESIDEKVKAKAKTADKENKLEEVAKSIQQQTTNKKKEIESAKEENDFVTYADKNSAVKKYNSGSEEFYSSNGKDYYSTIMNSDDDSKPISAPQAEHQEQKAEESAEKAQYVSRESLVFGDNITMNGAPSKYEQTTLGASSTNTESTYMFKILHPGWWKCIYDLKQVNVSYN